MPDSNNYNVIYGFGYAKYIHQSDGIYQEETVFVPKDESVKINLIKLKNVTPNKKILRIFYYTKLALGEDEIKSDGNICVKLEPNNNMLEIKNLYLGEIEKTVAFITSSEKIKSFTGSKKFFFGNGGISNPDGIQKIALNNEPGIGESSCAVIEVNVELESFSEKEISIILGACEDSFTAKDLAYKYSKINNCSEELRNVTRYWENLLERVTVSTPVESINIMLNGWTMYQTIACRLFARSGYYQSGGAFGYRDQLQDAMGTKYLNPEILKNQIIKHSMHQFIEGDVLHWWHDDTKRGIRTRFSDDLLWLPYAVLEYVKFTGDRSILDIETYYLQGKILNEGEDEKYDKFEESDIKESILLHCLRAISYSLRFGKHGLPKIGSGDWNDGFSEVGNKGKGESVWLGFFLYTISTRFVNEILCSEDKLKQIMDQIQAKSYQLEPSQLTTLTNNLKKSLNTAGWDGRWFKRAFMDDGSALGSMENEECRIDSIAQSWAVISGAGDNDKKFISMQSLETHLVDKELGIIKLLDPPFEKGAIEPGYIKAYMPGVRENGGQYTHAAIWAIIANSILGFGDKAIELYKMINPIEHSRFRDAVNKFKVEPYVIPADIYGSNNLAGRGGWTWYTGSSSWFYTAGIEYILGLKITNNILRIEPCIPKEWKEYSIRYKYKTSIYDFCVKNFGTSKKIFIDGIEYNDDNIRLVDDGKRHEIIVKI